MKTAFVSGASGGIGLEICRTLLSNGYNVIAQYNSNKKPIEDLKEEMKNQGLSDFLHLIKCDFNDSLAVKECADFCALKFGGVDAFISNAGIDLYKLYDLTESKEWDEVMNVNLKSAFLLSRRFVKDMISKKAGRIVFISSVWGEVGASIEAVYSASKAGLIGLSKSLAKELAPSSITVNCVCPGVIDTPMNSCFSKEEMKEIVAEIPLRRLGSPTEIAKLVAFLLSEHSSYITGAVITADGGYTL